MLIIACDKYWNKEDLTEQQAFRKVIEYCAIDIDNIVYVAFPWSTLFTLCEVNSRNEIYYQLIEELQELSERARKFKRCFTVCQHPNIEKFLPYFNQLKITDIFWTYYQRPVPKIEIAVHRFPFFAEENFTSCHKFKNIGLANFLKEKTNNDETDAIATEISNFLIQNCSTTHNSGESLNITLALFNSSENSRELWEAINAGMIPVFLSSEFSLPGRFELWERASLYMVDTVQSIEDVFGLLLETANNKEIMLQKQSALEQIKFLYGNSHFVSDIIALSIRAAAEQALEHPLTVIATATVIEKDEAHLKLLRLSRESYLIIEDKISLKNYVDFVSKRVN